MRRIALASAFAMAFVASAEAADPPDFLRGPLGHPAPAVDWSGYYVGLHGAMGRTELNFTEGMGALPGADPLGKESSSSSGFGGFVGYNAQWDEALLGVELNYTYGDFGGSKTVTVGPLTTFGSIDIDHMATARFRAGWAPGMFMPYIFGGVAFGIADVARTVTNGGVVIGSIVQDSRTVYGYAGGAGVELLVFGNAFLRAEFEYSKFAAPIDTGITTGRVGFGWKF